MLLTEQRDLGAEALHGIIRARASALWEERAFFQLLNGCSFEPPNRPSGIGSWSISTASGAAHRSFLFCAADGARQAPHRQRQAACSDRQGHAGASGGKGMSRSAAIIGSGFGGLALGIRLQSAASRPPFSRLETSGRPCLLLGEGGPHLRCRADRDYRSRLSEGPVAPQRSVDRAGCGASPVSPFYRLSWPDGSFFDYSMTM
jgi:hypothetical protein